MDFKRDINSWVSFFSYVFFSCTFSSASLPSPLSLRMMLLSFLLVFICISRGAAFSSHWFSFTSLLFTGFVRVRLALFSASSTFVWCTSFVVVLVECLVRHPLPLLFVRD